MDLVERYIEAVKFWLPARLKEDIAAELLEDIRSQIEEAERQKGRKLTEDEVAAILKARGTPLSVASRYLPQHALIGPELFPLYIFVLKIVAVICFIPPIIAWVTHAFINPATFPPGLFASPVNSLLVSFAIVTIIFAIIERRGVNPAKNENWNPRTLRPVLDRNRIKRSTLVADIVGNLILIGFFLAGYLSQFRYDFPGGHVTLSPEWIPFCQVVVAIGVAEIAFSAAKLFKPYWTATAALVRMLIDLAKTAAFCWVLQSHLLRELAVFKLPPPAAEQLLHLSETAAQMAYPVACLVGAGIAAAAIWRVMRSRHPNRLATA